MTEETIATSNDPGLWIAASFSIICVLAVAIIFLRKTIKDADKLGLSKDQIKKASRAATITSIGPVFVLLSAMLTLMLYVGPALAWTRINFIGSASYELQATNFAADGMGLSLGQSSLSPEFLATASIVMPVGCIGWVVFSALFSDKMDKVNDFMSGGNDKLVPILGAGALIGVFSSMTIDQALPLSYSTVAVIVGAVTMLVIDNLIEKNKTQWLKEWGLTIAMVAGVLVAGGLEYLNILG